MAIMRWNPFRDLMRLENEMNRLMQRVFGRPALPARAEERPLIETRGWAPAVDVIDKKDKLIVKAELPGVEKEDIDISISGNVLTLKGETKREKEVKEEDYYCCERYYGGFSRSIDLPAEVDASKVDASFKNGILEITLPKSKVPEAKKIPIK